MRMRHVKGSDEYIAASPFVINEPEGLKGRWRTAAFPNEADAPLYLEIGMGMGTFIRAHSFRNPKADYIGLEIVTTPLYKALRRYENELRARLGDAAAEVAEADEAEAEAAEDADDADAGGTAALAADELVKTSNLRFIRADARLLDNFFEAGEVDRIYLNFSDPWPKDKNANKRLTSPHFLELYRKVMKKDGIIEFKTDNRGLFDYTVETLAAEGWTIRAITYDLHNDADMNEGNVMTEYEAKFSEKGNPIYKLITCYEKEE